MRVDRVKKINFIMVMFYSVMLLLQSAALCFAETAPLEGKIIGTGPLKVWLNIGTEKGVETDMVFSVNRGDEIIAKIQIKKTGTTSSEAAIIQLKDGGECKSGDSVTFLSKPVTEIKKEDAQTDKPADKTTAETPAPVTATTTAATPVAETKPEDKKQEVKKAAKKKKNLFSISSTKFLYIAIIGVAAFAIMGGNKNGSGGGDASGSVYEVPQNPPPSDF